MAALAAFVTESAFGQTQTWREMHKVKKKETLFGIARQYGLTVQELLDANPEMNKPGYELKKDAFILIPYAKDQTPAATPAPTTLASKPVASKQKNKTIKLGVMLPLHDINGDGRRMVDP